MQGRLFDNKIRLIIKIQLIMKIHVLKMAENDRTCVPNHGRTLQKMVKHGKRCAPKHIKTAEYALQNMAEHIRTFVP